jgi:hypothetical protein
VTNYVTLRKNILFLFEIINGEFRIMENLIAKKINGEFRVLQVKY